MKNPVERATAFALVAAGFGAGVAQVLLLRELLVIAYGNELSMGVLLACWLLAGALGSLIARRLRELARPYGGAAMRMIRLAVLPAPALVLSLAFARAVPLLLSTLPEFCTRIVGEGSGLTEFVIAHIALRPGEMLGLGQMLTVALLAALLPAALDGAQFVVGCDLYARARGREEGVGAVYALDAIGHLLGGVLLGWAVAIAFNPFTMAVLVGAVNLVAATVLAGAAFGLSGRPRTAVYAGIVIATLLSAYAAQDLHRASLRWRWQHQELLANIESIYGNIAITRQKPDGIYLYQNGLYTGASPPLQGTVDEFVHFALLQHPAPKRILLIGGGILGSLAEILKYNPESVYYLELDGAVLRIADRWIAPDDLRALDDPRVHARQGDGRRFVKRGRQRDAADSGFDAVLVSLPDPATAQLNRFYTREWFEEVRGVLAPGGILAWQAPGAEAYFSPALLALDKCLYETARGVFPNLVTMPGERAVVVCSIEEGDLTEDWMELEQRLHARGIEAQYFEALLPNMLDPIKLANVQESIEQAAAQPINRDLRPIGFFLDQAHWLTQFHPESAPLLKRAQSIGLRQILGPVVAATLLLLCLAWVGPVRAFFVPLSVAATGFISMALEVALLFAFQAIYGYVYHKVGVIIGAFMVGLAAGAILTGHWLEGKGFRRVNAGLALVQGFGAALAAVLGLALPAFWGQSGAWLQSPTAAVLLFPLVTALVGLGVGVQFPLASAAWAGASHQARAAAGLYAADLIGASVGALATGALLAPVLGIPGTCAVAAGLGGGMAILLAVRAGLSQGS